MSRLINVSDSVYEQLTRIKRAKGQSYSEAIAGMLPSEGASTAKTDNWDDLIAWIKENDKKFKGKKVKIDHDQILYGDSDDGS
ncbi:MAG: antitoxin VapB family protein [Candidatus Micrarchaeia archaeon]|jgi:predicted CopG family antitoxin